MNGLDLFSGIGGLSLALSPWVRPIAYCEKDPYCQGVLLSRIASGDLECAPIWDDIDTLEPNFLNGFTDIIYGGFPCQDISYAGIGKGLAGERSGLFYQIVRLAKEIEPAFIFLENVPAITCRGGLEVVREITSLGYDCRWCIISAASVGARHIRKRWFILAHSKSKRLEGCGSKVGIKAQQSQPPICCMEDHRKENEPSLVGMVDGIPQRVDRTRALGNSVVPQQAKEAFKILMGFT